MSKSKRNTRLPARIDNQNNDSRQLQAYTAPVHAIASYNIEAQQSSTDRGSAKDLMRILRKRYWTIIGFTFASFLLAFLYCVFAPKMYSARTTLEIRGYDSLLNSLKVEGSIEEDTRKTAYQKTTTAKLKHIGLANESLQRNNLAFDLKRYFNSRNSALGNFIDYIKESFSDPDEFAVEPVIDAVPNHDTLFSFPENFLKSYLGLISVNPLNETSLVQISVVTTSPALSQRVANQHADVFIDLLRKERQAELSSKLDALNSHSQLLKDKLGEAERKLSEYAKKNSLLGLTAGRDKNAKGENVVVKGMSELSGLLAAAKGNRIRSESKLDQFRRTSQTGSVTDDDKLIQSLRLTLKEVEAEYAALNSKVTAEYPPLRELGAQIQSLKKSLAEEKEIKLGSLQAQLDSDIATEKELIAELEKEQSKVNDSSSKLVNYEILAQEVESLRQLTNNVLQEQMQTQIAAASSKSNIFVTDYAALSTKPISPQKKLILSFSVLLGLLLGLAIAVIVEVVNNRIETPEDAEDALGLPVLGSILAFNVFKDETGDFTSSKDEMLYNAGKYLPFLKPFLSKASKKSPLQPLLPAPENANISNKDEERVVTNPLSASTSISSSPISSSPMSSSPMSSSHRGLVSISSPNAAVSEALRSIRASILFSSADAPPKVILVTSAGIGEGKTTVCSNLAVTLAQASYKTLLIEGDLRNPSCGVKFDMHKNRPGLVDFLTGHISASEAFASTEVPGLHILCAGSPSPKPSELIGSRKMAELLELLRDEFDYILIDSAPVLPVADSLTLASVVDGVVVVIRSGLSERSAAKETVRRLERVGANILGTVVNDLALRFSPYSVQSYYPNQYHAVFDAERYPEAFKPDDKQVVGL